MSYSSIIQYSIIVELSISTAYLYFCQWGRVMSYSSSGRDKELGSILFTRLSKYYPELKNKNVQSTLRAPLNCTVNSAIADKTVEGRIARR